MLDAHPDVSCEFQPKLLIVSDRELAPGRGVAPAVATPFGVLFMDPEDEELYRAKSELLRQINFLRADYPRTTVRNASPEVMKKLTRLHRRMARSLVE